MVLLLLPPLRLAQALPPPPECEMQWIFSCLLVLAAADKQASKPTSRAMH